MMKRKERPHRSASQLRLFKRCGVAYGFKYDDKVRGAKSVPAARGISVHDAVAFNLSQKVNTRHDLPLDAVTDRAAQAVDEQFAGALHLSDAERKIGFRKIRGATRDVAVEMTRAFHLRQAPHVKPLYVEKLIRVHTNPKRLAFDVVARIDHATRDHVVWDLKTTRSALRADIEHIDEQLTLYYPVHKAKTGKYPKAVGLLGVTQERAQPARIERRLSSRTPEDVRSIVNTLRVVDEQIRSGRRIPTAPENWWCSEKWCEFWTICPYVAGIRQRRQSYVGARLSGDARRGQRRKRR